MASLLTLAGILVCLCCWDIVSLKGLDEYCARETFTGRCKENEVMQMKSTKYGRMRVGRCVEKDLGYIGCQKDVLHILGSACSGKQSCEYKVLNDELFDTQPCGNDLTAYLEVEYDCLKVMTASAAECNSGHNIQSHDPRGYISSSVARQSGCGNMEHPWRISVLPGQRVNVTLMSFTKSSDKSHRKCDALGYIVETGHRNNITICSRTGETEHLYTSNGRHIDIYIDTSGRSEADFVVHYKVFGCPDLKVPPFSWYRREGDVTTIGCEGRDNIWTLRCEDGQWRGVIGNCSDNVAASIQRSPGWFGGAFDLKMITILCLVLGCVILIVIAGAVIALKLRDSAHNKPPSTMLLQGTQQRMDKGPLPPLPEHSSSSHYRSLIRQPDGQSLHSQTMPRPQQQQQHDMQGGEQYATSDYSNDWKFGTAPWQRPGNQC